MIKTYTKLKNKVYDGFLWFCGFISGETITKMLIRQKDRLGYWYYILLGVSICFYNAMLIRGIMRKAWGWVIAWIIIDCFLIWLIPHIYGVW